ncbi:MAG TPA: hypothetical protein VHM69_00180 [Rubrobacter sp.]|nr:hypothetical protein [Rubrobacter sp.]
MRTIARRLRSLADPGSILSVILGVFVGALFGAHYEPRPDPQVHRPDSRGRTYPENRDD